MPNDDKPIIKTFTLDGKYYLYDTFSNRLFELSKNHFIETSILYKIGIKQYFEQEKTRPEHDDIMLLINKGLLRAEIIQSVHNYLTPYLKYMLKSCVNDIVLQVTKDCNFKCRYCGFAVDNNVDRCHTNQLMPLSIATKSIDFLFDHSRDVNTIGIAFYGGEPLLNFQLVQSIVEYTVSKFNTKRVEFRITTNGSLLTDNIVRFLVEHKFRISVSFDGPEYVQNLHRTFKSNGKGTYKNVFSNFTKIREQYPEFFYTNVSVMPVVVEGEDYESIIQFFNTIGVRNEQVKMLNAELNGIDYHPEKIENKKNQFQNVSLADAYTKLEEVFDKKIMLPQIWHHNGTCVPGIKRLFIDCDGTFFPCEKILFRDNLSIGNLNDGFDYSKIESLMNIGELSADRCKKCWAMRFCEICFSTCNDIEKCAISRAQKEKQCDAQEAKALWFLKKIIQKGYEQ